jgi:hypothetical protein
MSLYDIFYDIFPNELIFMIEIELTKLYQRDHKDRFDDIKKDLIYYHKVVTRSLHERTYHDGGIINFYDLPYMRYDNNSNYICIGKLLDDPDIIEYRKISIQRSKRYYRYLLHYIKRKDYKEQPDHIYLS